mmetsp:Transcript_13256/g.31118  ORF Transcript_13256/g.31118 Transcript_13256/m.31118 type:complete len:216 (+) Transcript_13256:942-1589(+)
MQRTRATCSFSRCVSIATLPPIACTLTAPSSCPPHSTVIVPAPPPPVRSTATTARPALNPPSRTSGPTLLLRWTVNWPVCTSPLTPFATPPSTWKAFLPLVRVVLREACCSSIVNSRPLLGTLPSQDQHRSSPSLSTSTTVFLLHHLAYTTPPPTSDSGRTSHASIVPSTSAAAFAGLLDGTTIGKRIGLTKTGRWSVKADSRTGCGRWKSWIGV